MPTTTAHNLMSLTEQFKGLRASSAKMADDLEHLPFILVDAEEQLLMARLNEILG